MYFIISEIFENISFSINYAILFLMLNYRKVLVENKGSYGKIILDLSQITESLL